MGKIRMTHVLEEEVPSSNFMIHRLDEIDGAGRRVDHRHSGSLTPREERVSANVVGPDPQGEYRLFEILLDFLEGAILEFLQK